MAFDAASVLARATSRAKSDVANKLVSMALHQVSQLAETRGRVRHEDYQGAVRDVFQNRCPYCGRPLDANNTVVEHLDAMNQFRAGLHVAGNVLPACKQCNLEKRRDDQAEQPPLGESGWDSFLHHDGRCGLGCKTCTYWREIWPDESERKRRLDENLARIKAFRADWLQDDLASMVPVLKEELQALYREAQQYAEERAHGLATAVRRRRHPSTRED